MANQQVKMIDTAILEFDPANPRFYRLNDSHSIEAVVEEMLDDESVQDLMLSIGQKGYFEGEPLLVVRKPGGHFTVVEGNRRLAAGIRFRCCRSRRTRFASEVRSCCRLPP